MRIIDSWGYKIAYNTLMSSEILMSWRWFKSNISQHDTYADYDTVVDKVYDIVNDKIWFMVHNGYGQE